MIRIMASDRGEADGERGDTLIELMIVMIIFTLIIGIVTTAIVTMMRQVDKQSGLDSNLGNARKAIETLDGQIRFANAITTPGTGASGDQYVEFQTLETNLVGQPQVCTQWRYHVAEICVAVPQLAGSDVGSGLAQRMADHRAERHSCRKQPDLFVHARPHRRRPRRLQRIPTRMTLSPTSRYTSTS